MYAVVLFHDYEPADIQVFNTLHEAEKHFKELTKTSRYYVILVQVIEEYPDYPDIDVAA